MKEFLTKYKSSVLSGILLIVLLAGYKYQQYKIEEANELFSSNLQEVSGETMGTTYSLKYIGEEQLTLKADIDSLLVELNNAVSTYVSTSEISNFNQTGVLKFRSKYFKEVLFRSKEIYNATNGYFDPTVMPLVNAYGFGYAKESNQKVNVDSLLQYVGFDKIIFNSDSVWITANGVQLDFSAIAKGYGVDIVAKHLRLRGINDFMLEIGGEVLCSGNSITNKPWLIGIENPLQSKEGEDRVQERVSLLNQAMATSGNYRNFYEKDGQVYAHTINPFSGLSETSNLLSATIVSPDCMTADALATASMAMGIKKAKELSRTWKASSVYYVYTEGKTKQVYSTLNK